MIDLLEFSGLVDNFLFYSIRYFLIERGTNMCLSNMATKWRTGKTQETQRQNQVSQSNETFELSFSSSHKDESDVPSTAAIFVVQ